MDNELYTVKKFIWATVVAVAFAIASISLSFTNSCAVINKKLNQDEDWIGEEIIEAVIQHQTGISLDLTPESPEN